MLEAGTGGLAVCTILEGGWDSWELLSSGF